MSIDFARVREQAIINGVRKHLEALIAYDLGERNFRPYPTGLEGEVAEQIYSLRIHFLPLYYKPRDKKPKLDFTIAEESSLGLRSPSIISDAEIVKAYKEAEQRNR